MVICCRPAWALLGRWLQLFEEEDSRGPGVGGQGCEELFISVGAGKRRPGCVAASNGGGVCGGVFSDGDGAGGSCHSMRKCFLGLSVRRSQTPPPPQTASITRAPPLPPGP